jgi:HEAT repeat protein
MSRKSWIMILAGLLAGGCYSPDPPSLSSGSAPTAVPAIKLAASSDDRKAIPQLVEYLDNHDPAIRFAAISALKRMTGQDLGYRYYLGEGDRRPAVERWKQWLKEHPSP